VQVRLQDASVEAGPSHVNSISYNQLGQRESVRESVKYTNIYHEIIFLENDDENDNDGVASGPRDKQTSALHDDDTIVYLHPVHSDVAQRPRDEPESDSEYDDAIIYLYPDVDDVI